MEKYGSDKPDIRFGLELHDVTEILKGKEGAKNLLRGDWAYWGKVKFDLENSRFDQLDSTVI
jgi:aspartyl-tRNA synthetase